MNVYLMHSSGLPNAQVLQRTGYYAATCTAPLLAHEYNPINTCVSNSTGDNHSFIISTTSTTYNQTFYIDSACTQVNTSVTFPLNACVNISALATTAEVVDQIFTPYQVEYYGMNSFYGSSCTGNRTQPITRTIYNYLCSDYTAAAGQSFPVSGLVTCNSTTIFVNFYFGSSCYDAVISTRFVASIGCQRDGTVNECICMSPSPLSSPPLPLIIY